MLKTYFLPLSKRHEVIFLVLQLIGIACLIFYWDKIPTVISASIGLTLSRFVANFFMADRVNESSGEPLVDEIQGHEEVNAESEVGMDIMAVKEKPSVTTTKRKKKTPPTTLLILLSLLMLSSCKQQKILSSLKSLFRKENIQE